MNDGAWKIASGRLCVACLQEMAAEYIIEPAFHGWARGVCQRCGKDQNLMVANEKLAADRKALINELCQYCGKYKQAHEGACDGCRWREL